jgi:PAS domain S-box-containing protein
VDTIDGTQTGEALGQSERYFRTLVQHALGVITVLDADGTVRYKSPGIERELGYTPDEVIGTNVFVLVHPDNLLQAQALVADLLRQAGAPLDFAPGPAAG